MAIDTGSIVAVAAVIVASMGLYVLSGRLGKSSQGTGTKFSPFTGGEELPQGRGRYHSELFVYAALFMVFEVFALLLASAIGTSNAFWPLVFTATGAITLFAAVLWFAETGGGKLA
jgi:NADH:ubiquinone oxidoreductase subunit 3 (subunit A)